MIRYIDIDGRTKLAIRNTISDYIPNPTFGKVAAPGAAGFDVTKGGEGMEQRAGRTVSAPDGKKMLVMPGVEAFFDPEPRLELMLELGIDRTVLWPTLASVLEERVADDPDAVVAVIHVLNQWLHEHWSFVFAGRDLLDPDHQLGRGQRRRDRRARVHRRARRQALPHPRGTGTHMEGTQVVRLGRVRPLLGTRAGTRSRRGHALGRPGYTRYTNEWEGTHQEYSAFRTNRSPAFVRAGVGEEQPRRRATRQSSATASRRGFRR